MISLRAFLAGGCAAGGATIGAAPATGPVLRARGQTRDAQFSCGATSDGGSRVDVARTSRPHRPRCRSSPPASSSTALLRRPPVMLFLSLLVSAPCCAHWCAEQPRYQGGGIQPEPQRLGSKLCGLGVFVQRPHCIRTTEQRHCICTTEQRGTVCELALIMSLARGAP